MGAADVFFINHWMFQAMSFSHYVEVLGVVFVVAVVVKYIMYHENVGKCLSKPYVAPQTPFIYKQTQTCTIRLDIALDLSYVLWVIHVLYK